MLGVYPDESIQGIVLRLRIRMAFHSVFSTWIATAILLALVTAAQAADTRPNVLLIVADDLNCRLGCYGDTTVRSPHIDRLAARGMRFDRAYCQYPVCNPSRTSFLSGLRPDTTGIRDNVTLPRAHLGDRPFLPDWFRRHGYRTARLGKLFHTGNGFRDPVTWDIDIKEQAISKKPPLEQIARRQGDGGLVLSVDDAQTWDGWLARRAVQTLEQLAGGDAPYFLAVGFRRPHTPYIAPARYYDLYPSEAMPLPIERAEHLVRIPRPALTHDAERPSLAREAWRPTVAAYFASISFLDAQLGLLLDACDRLDAWRDTVVVFLGDHGYHLFEHGGLQHKMTLFEESARVPLLIAAPGKPPGASRALVELVDLYPTLCELCALPATTDLEGASAAPLLTEPERPWKQAAFTIVSRGGSPDSAGVPLDDVHLGRTIRTDRWRYTEWFDGGRELYDHDADPREQKNLAGERSLAEIERGLARQLQAGWRAALPQVAK